MQKDPSCSVCGRNEWLRVHDYHFEVDKTPASGTEWDNYIRLRRRVLFEIWFPGEQAIDLTSVMCRQCGFMTYTPRPETQDVDAKYRFLQKTEKDIGGQKPDRRSQRQDRRRADNVCRVVSRHVSGRQVRVLDVGGGNGKILLPFKERGDSCFLVDYNVRPIKGVEKIADRLEDVPEGLSFDVIICTHVLEHLAEPDSAVKKMKTLLADGGLIYAEVPLGVWGGIGIEEDPVTHINFFTKPSYEALFLVQGCHVYDIQQMVGTYNRRLDVIYAVAGESGDEGTQVSMQGRSEETERLLNLTLAMKLQRLWRLRKMPPFKRFFGVR